MKEQTRRWWVLATVATAQLMVVAPTTDARSS
jgi:hypothetical protein